MPTFFVSDEEFAAGHGIPLSKVAAAKRRLAREGDKLAVNYDPADYAADEDDEAPETKEITARHAAVETE